MHTYICRCGAQVECGGFLSSDYSQGLGFFCLVLFFGGFFLLVFFFVGGNIKKKKKSQFQKDDTYAVGC